MSHSTDSFVSADGFRLFEQAWLPDGDARAVVLIVHGLGEHSGRHAATATLLRARGYAVYAYDHQGHGQSQGVAPILIERFDSYADDLAQMVRRVRLRAGDRPTFLLGQSMGGAIIAYAIVKGLIKPDGIILTSPALVIDRDQPRLLVQASGVLSRLAPRMALPPLDARLLARDPRVGERYTADPLVYNGGVPVRTAAELLRATRVIRDGVAQITMPLLLLHGTADKITHPEGSMQLYARAAATDKTLRLFDGAYHELHNEDVQDEVRGLIADWLDAHSSAAETESHHQRRARQRKERPDHD